MRGKYVEYTIAKKKHCKNNALWSNNIGSIVKVFSSDMKWLKDTILFCKEIEIKSPLWNDKIGLLRVSI